MGKDKSNPLLSENPKLHLCTYVREIRARFAMCVNPTAHTQKMFRPKSVSLFPDRGVRVGLCVQAGNFSRVTFPPHPVVFKKAPLTYSRNHRKSQFVFFVLNKTPLKLLTSTYYRFFYCAPQACASHSSDCLSFCEPL